MADKITGCLLLAFAIWFGYSAWTLPAGLFADPIGSRMFPLGVALFMTPLALILIFRPTPVSGTLLKKKTWPAMGLVLLVLIGYAELLSPLGFILATILAFEALALLFGAPFWKGLLSAIISTIVLYVLFSILLDLYLPTGTLLKALLP